MGSKGLSLSLVIQCKYLQQNALLGSTIYTRLIKTNLKIAVRLWFKFVMLVTDVLYKLIYGVNM